MVAPERVWTPWRMTYLAGDAVEDGCVFCNRFAEDDDVASLILHRAERTFVIMNLFPYGSGHVMILPNAHVASPQHIDAETRHEMADMLPLLMTVMQCVFGCEGFNSGFNLGAAGGGGITEHLHQHVVPRWTGDANFFPIIASTKAIPELLPSQYAKLRLEIERVVLDARPVTVVALVDDDTRVITVDDTLPIALSSPATAVWRSALGTIESQITAIEVAGWGGDRRCGSVPDSEPTIVFRGKLLPHAQAFPIAELKDPYRMIVERARAGLAPTT